jgi:hypothetical protein
VSEDATVTDAAKLKRPVNQYLLPRANLDVMS